MSLSSHTALLTHICINPGLKVFIKVVAVGAIGIGAFWAADPGLGRVCLDLLAWKRETIKKDPQSTAKAGWWGRSFWGFFIGIEGCYRSWSDWSLLPSWILPIVSQDVFAQDKSTQWIGSWNVSPLSLLHVGLRFFCLEVLRLLPVSSLSGFSTHKSPLSSPFH